MATFARTPRVIGSTIALLGLLAAVLVVPLQPSVRVDLIRIALLALSVHLPLMAGQLSLASPGFYALGGYVAAVMSTRYVRLDEETGYWKFRALGRTWTSSRELYDIRFVLVELVIAAVLAAVLGVAVGYFALRLKGIYLALATIAFVEVLRLATLEHSIFGGATGIFDIPQPFDTQLDYLWLAVPMLLVAALFVYRLERSRVGLAFTAIREDELAASANGIKPAYYKNLAFSLGAVVAAMAGVLAGHFLNTWNARQGTFEVSTVFLACVVIGGSRTFLGPIVGAFVLTAIPEALRWLGDRPALPETLAETIKNGRLFVYGLLMVVVCIFFPKGLVAPRFVDWLFPKRARPGSGASSATFSATTVTSGPSSATSLETP
jgi:branched-chain amino acid transport system permease protein